MIGSEMVVVRFTFRRVLPGPSSNLAVIYGTADWNVSRGGGGRQVIVYLLGAVSACSCCCFAATLTTTTTTESMS